MNLGNEKLPIEKTPIEKIAEYHGLTSQKEKLIEEAAELIVAITHGNLRNTIEEIADVQILIDQIIYLLDIGREVWNEREYKIQRHLLQIEKEEEQNG